MAAYGERLKQARLKQGKSLQDLAAQTRISVQFLEAIEAGNLDAIPGEFFRRSFLKQYASALGVNPDEVQPERPMEFRSLGGAAEAPLAEVRYHEPPDLPPLPAMGQSRGVSWRQVFLSVGLLVGVLAVCAVAYTLWEDFQINRGKQEAAEVDLPPPPTMGQDDRLPEAGEDQQPQDAVGASAQFPSATGDQPMQSPLAGGEGSVAGGADNSNPAPGEASTLPVPSVASAPAVASPPGSGSPADAAPTESSYGSGSRELRLSASAPTWVQAREGERTVFVGVINPGETRVLRLNEGARLVVGNAGGLNVVWQGKDVSPVGPLGQVRIVTVSADGVSVAAPVKNAPSGGDASQSQSGE